MKKLCLVIIGCVFLCFFSVHVFADEIFTENGNRFRGDIISEDENQILIETREGKVIIDKTQVLHIERGEIPAIQEGKSSEKQGHGESISLEKRFTQMKNNVAKWAVDFHQGFIGLLEKIPTYQRFATIRAVRDYRQENALSYYVGVYSIVFFILVIVLNIIRIIIESIVRKIFGIEKKYDL